MLDNPAPPMPIFVVDTSVVAKLFLAYQSDSEISTAIFQKASIGDVVLLAPFLLLNELTNSSYASPLYTFLAYRNSPYY